ncbi:MAG: LuxR C-terminal-related transcriptional regulator [Firmicutes bacterium]|nr:LuxR C-terminal-related transcriptional regulator [Bacillota bacterium]
MQVSAGREMRMKSLLTNREREVFELLVQDRTTREIAESLFISEKTVRNHISNVMKKLNVKGRSQAVVELVRLGEIQI